MIKKLDFEYEINLWRQQFIVIGVDEVGRGSLAGPIVAAACVFPENSKPSKIIIINDSKKLSARQREVSAVWIRKTALMWAIAEIDVATINRIGIARAGIAALRKAVYQCSDKVLHKNKSFVLSDYFHIPYLKGIGQARQKAIVKGDAKCFSIAAASIIAKVYRDALMRRMAENYLNYGWERNKGYGTEEHRIMIKRFGLTKLHRRDFVRNLFKEN